MLEQENIAVGGPAQGIAEALLREGNAALLAAALGAYPGAAP